MTARRHWYNLHDDGEETDIVAHYKNDNIFGKGNDIGIADTDGCHNDNINLHIDSDDKDDHANNTENKDNTTIDKRNTDHVVIPTDILTVNAVNAADFNDEVSDETFTDKQSHVDTTDNADIADIKDAINAHSFHAAATTYTKT